MGFLPSAIWTNPDGTIDEEIKADVLKSMGKFSRASARSKRRVILVTNRFKPLEYSFSPASAANNGINDTEIPCVMYETGGMGSYCLLDYLITFVEEATWIKYEHKHHKRVVSEFTRHFKIKSEKIDNNVWSFEDEEGNLYSYKTLWFYLCRFVLREKN